MRGNMRVIIVFIILINAAWSQDYARRISVEGVGTTATEDAKERVLEFLNDEAARRKSANKFQREYSQEIIQKLLGDYNTEVEKAIGYLNLKNKIDVKDYLLLPENTLVTLDFVLRRSNYSEYYVPILEIKNTHINKVVYKSEFKDLFYYKVYKYFSDQALKVKSSLTSLADVMEVAGDDLSENQENGSRIEGKDLDLEIIETEKLKLNSTINEA